jgi:outer membrane protein assembly factor BamB
MRKGLLALLGLSIVALLIFLSNRFWPGFASVQNQNVVLGNTPPVGEKEPAENVKMGGWPQWGGPARNGISPEKGLLKTWPKEGPVLVWTFEDAGLGYTAPAVVGGKVYLMGSRKGTEYLFALDAKGKELWATAIGPLYDWKGNQWSSGPNATPAVSGDTIVTVGSQGILLCTDLAGKMLWKKDLVTDLAAEVNPIQCPTGKSPAWGFSWSPLIDGDQVIITPGGAQGLVAALDKKTGNVLWQSKEAKDMATYSSPMLAEIGGVKQVVVMVQDGAVGVSAKDGALLWRYTRAEYPDILASSPLIKGNQVYLAAGWNGGAALVEITTDGKKFNAKEVYAKKEIGNKQGGVVLLDGFLYGFHEDRCWMCQDWATGAVKWESNRRGLGAGSMIYADGNLYCQGEQGDVGLIAASPEKYVQNGKFKLPKASELRKPSGRVWTRPVISDGLLYLRDQELVFCYKIK